jgi:RNA polymerase sigma factor (sigma-70 family)
MTKKIRTEITIETDRLLIIRRHRTLIHAWCAACSEVVKMTSPEDAARLAQISSRQLYRAVEAGSIHFLETLEGMLLVCLNSLAAGKSNSGPKDSINDHSERPMLKLAARPDQASVFENSALESSALESSALEGSAFESSVLESFDCAQAIEILSEKTCDVIDANGLTRRKKLWVLTEEAFNKLLARLDDDREQAARSYEAIRRRLIKYFECRGCFSPEDQTDETINRVARRICEGKEIWANQPASYFYGVARNVLREYWISPEREFSTLDALSSSDHPFEDALKNKREDAQDESSQKRLACLESCLQEFSPENRETIIAYYQGEKGERIRNRKLLARRLGIPANALRIRIYRLRERLERSVAERLRRRPRL